MTSIEKDLRELAEKIENMKRMAEKCDAEGMAETPQKEWTPYQGKILAYDYCAGELESLIPRIVAAVEQAQTDAIQSAAEHRRIQVCGDPNSAIQWYGACSCGQLKANGVTPWAKLWKDHILSLTPRRVQIEAELRELKAKLSEANAWASHATRYDRKIWATDRIALLNTEIATLERELEAERKGV